MEKTYKTLKIVLLVLCFVALLLGASRLYDALGSRMEMSNLVTEAPAASQETIPEAEVSDNQTEAPETTEPEKQLAPDFTVYDIEGNAHKLSDYRGKPVVLNFWASWCGPCKSEMPDFDEKYQLNADQVQFLMVNLTDGSRETVETASEFIAQQGYTFPVFLDSDMSAAIAYGVSAVPVTYLIDAEGCIVGWAQGAISGEALQGGIDRMLSE